MTKRGALVLLLAFALAGSLGFSQSSGSGNSSNGGTSSTASGVANASTIVYAGGSGSVQAFPGVSGTAGVFPGFPEQNGSWGLYFNWLFEEVPMTAMEAGRGKHDKIHSAVLLPDALPSENNEPIHLLGWSPFGPDHYDNDKAIYTAIIDGKVGEPVEQTLLAGFYDAKKKSHTDRCVAFIRIMNEGVTKGFSLGTGGSGGMTPGPGKNNDTVAFAGGGLLGKNTTREANYSEFRLVCLNKGPLDPPKRTEESAKTTAPTMPPPQPEPKAPPVQTIRIEVVAAPATPMATIAPSAAPINACDLPDFVIHFGFNESNVREEYRSKIANIEAWLENHPACRVQVEGHTCTIGSHAYNAALARDRAKAVYDLLDKDEKIQGQLTQFVSLSKDKATSERNPGDRRVILRVVGNASGR